MKRKDLGSLVRVYVSAKDVAAFNASWPCSDIPERPIWFEFDRKNGDLVDISPGFSEFDGPALAALSNDAGDFALNP